MEKIDDTLRNVKLKQEDILDHLVHKVLFKYSNDSK